MEVFIAAAVADTYLRAKGAVRARADDPEFASLIVHGLANRGAVIATSKEPLFHEAGIWLPRRREWMITSNRLPGPRVKVHTITVGGDVRESVLVQQAVPMANGGTSDGNGGAILCSQGLHDVHGSLYSVCPRAKLVTSLLTKQRFNSPNDVVRHGPTGCILFTDPTYGEAQGFRDAAPAGTARNALWCVAPDGGGCFVLDDDFVKPNGVCLSPDGSTLYVTDSGFYDGAGGEGCGPRHVLAYDLVRVGEADGEGAHAAPLALRNRRLFYALVDGEGIPDGLKADQDGRLWIGCGDGVHVVAADGRRLGKLLIEGGGVQLCFGGAAWDTLLVLAETRAITVRTTVRGALEC